VGHVPGSYVYLLLVGLGAGIASLVAAVLLPETLPPELRRPRSRLAPRPDARG
jgi:hypothetical protein